MLYNKFKIKIKLLVVKLLSFIRIYKIFFDKSFSTSFLILLILHLSELN